MPSSRPTDYGRRLVHDRLGVPEDRIYVCRPGAPSWTSLGQAPNVPSDGLLLFVGTLEPRKNIGTLLDAYEVLLAAAVACPRCVLAGRATAQARQWLARIDAPRSPAACDTRGYVADERT